MSKYWIASCMFERDRGINLIHRWVIKAKTYSSAKKKFWKAMSFSPAHAERVKGLKIQRLYHWAENEDVFYVR